MMMRGIPFHRIYEKAIAALNAGMKEPEDQNPEVRYTERFWFQPNVIRHELQWLLHPTDRLLGGKTIQTFQTRIFSERRDPSSRQLRIGGSQQSDKVQDRLCSLQLRLVRTFGLGHHHGHVSGGVVLRDKDGTLGGQRVDDTEGVTIPSHVKGTFNPFEVIRQHV